MKRPNPLTETETPVRPTRYSKDSWEIVECLETGMVFLRNPPDYGALEEKFAWEKTSVAESVRRRTEEPVFSRVSHGVNTVRRRLRKRRRIEKLFCAAMVESHARRGHVDAPVQVLDVGCGSARYLCSVAVYLREVHQIAVTPLGLEISRALAAEADANLGPLGGQSIHGPALAGLRSLPDDTVQGVMLHSYLEHEWQPLPVFRAIQSKLVRGGTVAIKVPNFGSWNRLLRQQRWCGFRYPDHVNYFTPDTLTQIVERAGLSIKRMNLRDRFPTNDNMYAIATKP